MAFDSKAVPQTAETDVLHSSHKLTRELLHDGAESGEEIHNRRSDKRGMLPGTPVYVGRSAPHMPHLRAILFDKDTFCEKTLDTLAMLDSDGDLKRWRRSGDGHDDHPDASKILWLHIDGLADTDLLMEIGRRFCINPLAVEDILNTEQRTKIDDYDELLFIVMKMLEARGNGRQPSVQKPLEIAREQVSFVLGRNFLLTFIEDPGDAFDAVRFQLRENKGKVRRLGTDFLLYSLMDCIVDQYFTVIETLGEHLEHLSEVLIRKPTPQTLRAIHRMRQQTIQLRRCLWPLREVLGHMQRDESDLIHNGTKLYLRDIYDHTVEVIDSIETNRDILSSMADMYLSASSYQLNMVMKVLTIISTIFIPLTFICSIYGMNFKFMPELEQPWGYPAVLALMLLLAIGMLVYFKQKKWLG